MRIFLKDRPMMSLGYCLSWISTVRRYTSSSSLLQDGRQFSNIKALQPLNGRRTNYSSLVLLFIIIMMLVIFNCEPIKAITCNGIDSNDITTCSGKGSCIQDETCQCLGGYSGTYCEYVECFGVTTEPGNIVCSGHGLCSSPNECQCDSGYYGPSCSITTCFGKWNNMTNNICSGHGSCNSLDQCECNAGYLGDECEKDLFAGYKLISISPIIIAKNSPGNTELVASIAIPSMVLSSAYSNDGSQALPYVTSNATNSKAVITDTSNDAFGQLLIQQADRKASELYNLPCDFNITDPDQELDHLTVIRNGGVYCFPNGLTINGHIFVIVGTETVLFRAPFVYYYGSTFYYLECASYRNVFWLTYDQGSNGNFFSGDIHGTVIGVSPYHGMQLYNNLWGAAWYIGGTDMILFDVTITPPITFDQNETLMREDCMEISCFGISHQSNTTCFGRGLCVKNDTCQCNQDSYGQTCNISMCNGVFGNESMVCNGNGKCASKDICECDNGYFGSWCELTTCFGFQNDQSSACSGHGLCSHLNTCICDSSFGFAGSNCEIPICYGILANESNVCSSRGQCVQPNQCNCPSNYIGSECQVTNCFGIISNDSSVCSSHGSCISADVCSCVNGYYGFDCSQFECFGIQQNNSSVCSGRGQCVNIDTCTCSQSYIGNECEVSKCNGILSNSSQVCNGYGQCKDTDSCECQLNYSGLFCNETTCNGIVSSDLTVCSGKGSCWPLDTCSCSTDYSGINCEIPVCYGILSTNNSVCGGHGVCSEPNVCQCTQNYYGSECTIASCNGILSNDSQTACSGHGSCISLDTCQCTGNYYGTNCELFDCFGVSSLSNMACSGHGSCLDTNSCQCNTNFYGNTCNITKCNGVWSNSSTVCSSKGNCYEFDTCQCSEHFLGSWCSITSCNGVYSNDSNTCSGHGSCVDYNTCQCSGDYSGTYCGNEVLDPFAGFRIISDSKVTISVDYYLTDWQPSLHSYTRYYSASLSLKEIAYLDSHTQYLPQSGASILNSTSIQGSGIVNKMKSTKSQLTSSLTCTKTYTNSDSPNTFVIKHGGVICFTGGMTFGPERTIIVIGTEPVIFKLPSLQYSALNIVYLECASYRNLFWILDSDSFIKGADKTTNYLPPIHGTFIQLSGTISLRGYLAGSVWASNINTLLHEVTFYDPVTFDPFANYMSPQCNFTLCYNIYSNNQLVCSGRGNCTDYNTCVCNSNSYGSSCSLFKCNGILSSNTTFTCNGRGSCVGPDICHCNQGYYGDFCELTTCNGIENTSPLVCNERGDCNHFNSCTCNANYGYGGSDCEIPICSKKLATNPLVCSSRGECTEPNVCICRDTYFGDNCELTTCNGTLSNSSYVCSGLGYCSGFDNCTCHLGYYGETCFEYDCFGVNAHLPTVCSGRGACSYVNNCTCEPGYFGNNCSLTMCYGIRSDSPYVCNSKGSCVGNNDCQCLTGYFGYNCTETSCGGVNSTDSQVCNGHGPCWPLETCTCLTKFGYAGQLCEIPICNSIPASDPTVCSTHGSCIGVNSCDCQTNYFGSNCQVTTCQGVQSNSSFVCSKHGSCPSFDNCTCQTGYYDVNCDKYDCYGVESQNSSVCSGRGNCTLPNTCSCSVGYYGNNCEKTKCNNILNDDATVCSGKGTCVGPNVCVCNDTYFGSNCELTTCNGTVSNISSVCSGNGVCWPYETCTCYSDLIREFEGKWCETRIWDPFAGFRLVSTNGLVYHHDFTSAFYQPDVNSNTRYFRSSLIISDFTKIYPTLNFTSDNGASIVNTNSPKGSYLAKLAKKKGESMWTIPCTKMVHSFSDLPWISANELLFRNGGVYCLDMHLYIDNTITIIVIGPEMLLLKVPSLNYVAVNFVFAECASYRNVFWFIQSYDPSFIQGGSRVTNYQPPIYGTFYPGYGGAVQFAGPLAGSIWASGNAWSVFYDVTVYPPLSTDPYEPIVGQFCNNTQCYNVRSNLNTTCSGRGQCIDYNKCVCIPDAYGADCSISKCNGTFSNVSTVCSGHGSCVAKDTCQCSFGYYGEWCQFTTCNGIDSTSPLACRERGICAAYNQCSCNTTLGYNGPDCEIPYCFNVLGNTSTVCNVHGTCQSPDNCTCFEHYFGSKCQYTTCSGIETLNSSVCLGRGQCTMFNNCTCNLHYNGSNCEQYTCSGIGKDSSNVCSGRGVCTDYNTCVCNNGYLGSNCEISYCYGILSNISTVCKGHGSCVATNTCVCATNYGSFDCSSTLCSGINSTTPSVCNGRGSCWPYNTCKCNTKLGYDGPLCDQPLCDDLLNSDPFVCNGKGVCVSPGLCTCNEPSKYFGKLCEYTYCLGIPTNLTEPALFCSGNGLCSDYDTCACWSGYSGVLCELDLFAGYRFFTNKNVYVLKNQIFLLPASIAIGPMLNAPGEKSYIPYQQALKTNLRANTLLLNELQLRATDLEYNFFPCTSYLRDASVLGKNIVLKGGVYCITNPWTLDGHNFTVVGKHRTIFRLPQLNYISAKFTYVECASYRDVIFYSNEKAGYSNFTGPIDATIFISAAADTVHYVNGDINGAIYIFGKIVNNNPPSGTVYTSNMKFIEPYTFDPAVRYIESKCNYYTCFGIGSNINTTCSGKGKCIDYDTCSCIPGSYGNDCSLYMCNGTLGNLSNVCTGQGSCIATDTCQCKAGFYGKWCQYTNCYGLENTSPLVCSGNGLCIAQNTCSCNSTLGYGGSQCDIPICGGMLGTCTSSSRGSCLAPDTCSCLNHYYGQFCQWTTCNNITSNSTNVCSGRGVCTGYNNCTCKAGYIGSTCEKDVFAGYKLISNKAVLLAKNSRASSILAASIALPSMTIRPPTFLNPDKVYPYVASGKAVITKPSDAYYTTIMTELSKKFDELMSAPCDYIISKPDTEMGQKILIEHGGVYCFKNGWNINGQKFTIVGTEPVIFKAPFIKYSGANFVYLKCGSYRNVFWVTQYYNLTGSINWVYSNSFSGTVHGTIVARYGYDYLVSDDIQGAIWFYSQEDGYITLKDAKLAAPPTFDPYLSYVTGSCDTYTCFGIDPTSNNSCSGRGVCKDYNNCICQENSYGTDCSISVCNGILGNVSNVCSSHGSCIDKDTCSCESGYFGDWCQYTTCSGIPNNSTNACNKRGVCNLFNSCTCNTTLGYGGSNCEVPICNHLVGTCTELFRGNCTAPNTCSCENHYYGPYCEITTCGGFESTNTANVCNGRGNCTSYDKCICSHGYGGTLCEEYTCNNVLRTLPSTCSGRGVCAAVDQCNCNANYYGLDCEISKCNGIFGNQSNVCSSKGHCIDTNICNCSENYYGPWCETTSCFGTASNDSSVCSHRGNCAAFNVCQCNPNYFGDNCELTSCNTENSNSASVCNSVGNCTDYNTCTCPSGYTGSWCEYTTCFGVSTISPSVCNARGNCSTLDKCTCDPKYGYGGSNCNIPTCGGILASSPNVCNSHGTCVSPNTCSCENHYYGETCQVTTCFGLLYNDSTVCSGKGSCDQYNNCTCQLGYSGSQCTDFTCSGTLNSDPQVCFGRGNCTEYDICVCNTDAFDFDCSGVVCNGYINADPLVCSSHGSCIQSQLCNCSENYHGQWCEYTTCNGIDSNSSEACSGKGRCIDYNTCVCSNGYYGNDCQDYNCFGISRFSENTCNGYGNCTGIDTCECFEDSIGFDCSINVCNGLSMNSSMVCSGLGNCTQPNYCNCSDHYFGSNCEWTTCFSVASFSPSTCSGRGNCSDFDSCICSSDAFGSDCSLFKCNNTFSNETMVCSGRGLCVGTEDCNCTENYHGMYCELTECFSVMSNESSVCSGKGKCVDFNTCVCNSGYFGSNCSQFSCNATLHNESSSVCSGRGSCIDSNICKCDEHYVGSNCEFTSCFAILSNDSLVCNGRGVCEDYQNCSCRNGFYGDNCEHVDSSNMINNQTNMTQFNNQTLNETQTNSSFVDTFNNSSNVSNQSLNSTQGVSPGAISNSTTNSTSLSNNTAVDSSSNSSLPGNTTLDAANNTLSDNNTSPSPGVVNNVTSPDNTTFDSNNTSPENITATSNSSDISNTSSIATEVVSNVTTPIIDISNYTDIPTPSISNDTATDDGSRPQNNSTITSNSTASNNSLVITNSTTTNVSLVPTNSTNSNETNIIDTVPIAKIKSMTSSVFSSCDDIRMDGSESFSQDSTSLDYYWNLLAADSMNIVSQNLVNAPILILEPSLKSGQYIVSLKVSTKSKRNSSITYSKPFTKSSNPLPKIYIANPLLEKYGNQFPVSIKKVVTESTCQSEKSVITWTQLSGPNIKYSVDTFNNLNIASLTTYGFHTYIFQVSAYYLSNPSEKVSSNVTLVTKSPDLKLELLTTEANSNYSIIEIDYTDPENLLNPLAEEWIWTCHNNTDPNLVSLLNSASTKKQTEIRFDSSLFTSSIPPSIEISLKIIKSDNRTISKSTIVYFGIVPPVVNIIAVEPSNYVLPGETLSIQTLVTKGNVSVTLNGDPIVIVDQSTFDIDTDLLTPGSENTVTITSTDASSGTSSSTTYTFKVATYPKPCSCMVSPQMGVAQETDFEFYCTNCKSSENNIDYRYGFIDDRSGTKILLFDSGEVYATKLPAPFSGTNVRCFFDIVDTVTTAFTTVYLNVSIEKPMVTQIEQVQGLVEVWTNVGSKYYSVGDFSKSIYQCASASRTDSVLLKNILGTEYAERSEAIIDCVNGVDISGICKCHDGYIGKHCDKAITDFSNIQDTKLKVLREMMTIANSTGEMNSQYLSLLSFAIDSILVNYRYLDSNTISECMYTLNMFLEYSLSDEGLKLSSGVDTLLETSHDSTYNYIKDKQYLTDQTSNALKLLKSLKLSSQLQARAFTMSNSKKNIKGSFFSIVMGKSFLSDHQNEIVDQLSSTKISMGSGFFAYNTRSKVSPTKKPYIYILSVTEDIYSLQTKLKAMDKKNNVNRVSSLVSPIVSVDFKDVSTEMNPSSIVYTIPINLNGSVFELRTGTFDISLKTLDQFCRNFDEGSMTLLSDCSLMAITDTYAKCQCSKFTNVFVIQTTTITTYSYTYLAAIGFSIIAVCSIGALIILSICVFCKVKKPKLQKQRSMVFTDTSETEMQLRIQEIILGDHTYGNSEQNTDDSLMIDVTDDCGSGGTSNSGKSSIQGRMRSYSMQERPTTLMVMSSSPPKVGANIVTSSPRGTRNRSSSVAPLIQEPHEIDSNASSTDELLRTESSSGGVKRSGSGIWDLREDGFLEHEKF